MRKKYTKINKNIKNQLLQLLAAGISLKKACDFCNIRVGAFYDELKRDSLFAMEYTKLRSKITLCFKVTLYDLMSSDDVELQKWALKLTANFLNTRREIKNNERDQKNTNFPDSYDIILT